MKDEHVKDAAQGVAEDVPQDVAQNLGERRAPSSPRHHRRRRLLCAARAEMRAQLGSSVAYLARAVVKRFRGWRAKRLYVDIAVTAYLCGSLLMLVALARRWLHHLSSVRRFRLRRNSIELPVYRLPAHFSTTPPRCRCWPRWL